MTWSELESRAREACERMLESHPWVEGKPYCNVGGSHCDCGAPDSCDILEDGVVIAQRLAVTDAAFVVVAREFIPAALVEVERLRNLVADLYDLADDNHTSAEDIDTLQAGLQVWGEVHDKRLAEPAYLGGLSAPTCRGCGAAAVRDGEGYACARCGGKDVEP